MLHSWMYRNNEDLTKVCQMIRHMSPEFVNDVNAVLFKMWCYCWCAVNFRSIEALYYFQYVICIIIGTKLIFTLSPCIVNNYSAIPALAFCDANFAIIKKLKLILQAFRMFDQMHKILYLRYTIILYCVVPWVQFQRLWKTIMCILFQRIIFFLQHFVGVRIC